MYVYGCARIRTCESVCAHMWAYLSSLLVCVCVCVCVCLRERGRVGVCVSVLILYIREHPVDRYTTDISEG